VFAVPVLGTTFINYPSVHNGSKFFSSFFFWIRANWFYAERGQFDFTEWGKFNKYSPGCNQATLWKKTLSYISCTRWQTLKCATPRPPSRDLNPRSRRPETVVMTIAPPLKGLLLPGPETHS
jgi:hypothetical protein